MKLFFFGDFQRLYVGWKPGRNWNVKQSSENRPLFRQCFFSLLHCFQRLNQRLEKCRLNNNFWTMCSYRLFLFEQCFCFFLNNTKAGYFFFNKDLFLNSAKACCFFLNNFSFEQKHAALQYHYAQECILFIRNLTLEEYKLNNKFKFPPPLYLFLSNVTHAVSFWIISVLFYLFMKNALTCYSFWHINIRWYNQLLNQILINQLLINQLFVFMECEEFY